MLSSSSSRNTLPPAESKGDATPAARLSKGEPAPLCSAVHAALGPARAWLQVFCLVHFCSVMRDSQMALSISVLPCCVFSAASAPEPAAPGLRWQLEASVGLIGLSILGSTPSSSCLKLEWHELRCSASNCEALVPPPPPAYVPANGGSRRSIGQAPTDGGQQRQRRTLPPVLLAGQVSWQQVSLHVMIPRVLPQSSSLATPFAAASVGPFPENRWALRLNLLSMF